MNETSYSHRTDSVARKIELLQEALAGNRHELARSLAESIRETITFQQQTDESPGDVDIQADSGQPISEFPTPWRDWAAGWRRFAVFALDETVGLARSSEPVEIDVRFAANTCAGLFRDVRLVKVDSDSGTLNEIPSQFLNERRRGAFRYGRLLFQADNPAHQRVTYLLLFDNPDAELPDYETDLRVEGEGYSLDIENRFYRASLSRQMGQLESLRYKFGSQLNLFSAGDGHGEPPGIDWAHDYVASDGYQKMRVTNWADCADYEVIRGPLCTVVRRWGFPHSTVHPLFTPSRMHITVEYHFFAGIPYFTKRGSMEVLQEMDITYLRDDEWVFSGSPVTDTDWMASDGKLRTGEVDEAQKDNLWAVGFFNDRTRDAFIALFLEHEAENFDGLKHSGPPVLHYQSGAQLWSRWAARGRPTLKAGAKLKQHNAYLTIPFPEENGKQIVEDHRHRLLNPLSPAESDLTGIRAQRSPTRLARPGERGDAAISKQALWDALREVRDRQLYKIDANVVDMGYIYDLRVNSGTVHIVMTMPHRGRPKFGFIGTPIRERLIQVPGVTEVKIENVWDPPWDANRLSDEARETFGF